MAHLTDLIDEVECECEGTGFFSLQSLVNHSCVPNVKIEQREDDLDSTIKFTATREIKAGEELTMNYIGDGLDFESRTDALKDYGFTCTCPLCASRTWHDFPWGLDWPGVTSLTRSTLLKPVRSWLSLEVDLHTSCFQLIFPLFISFLCSLVTYHLLTGWTVHSMVLLAKRHGFRFKQ